MSRRSLSEEASPVYRKALSYGDKVAVIDSQGSQTTTTSRLDGVGRGEMVHGSADCVQSSWSYVDFSRQ